MSAAVSCLRRRCSPLVDLVGDVEEMQWFGPVLHCLFKDEPHEVYRKGGEEFGVRHGPWDDESELALYNTLL
jgi:hypothetical protein